MKAAFCLCGKLVVLARTLECATTLICLSVRCKQWVGKFGSSPWGVQRAMLCASQALLLSLHPFPSTLTVFLSSI